MEVVHHMRTYLCVSLLVEVVVRVGQNEFLQAEGCLVVPGTREGDTH